MLSSDSEIAYECDLAMAVFAAQHQSVACDTLKVSFIFFSFRNYSVIQLSMLFLFLSLFVIEILRRERLRLLRECAVTVSFVRVRLKLHFSYFSFSVRPGLIKIMKSSSTSTSTRGQSLIASARENQNLKKPNSYKVFDYLL